MIEAIVIIAYLLSAVLFVWGIKLLSSPETARNGNLTAVAGMALAILTAILEPIENASNNYLWILIGLAIGSVIGLQAAKRVKMTAMPQLVSVFNGFGGACAVLLAIMEFRFVENTNAVGQLVLLATLLIGSLSFTGSMLAYLKLDGKVNDRSVTFPGMQYLNGLILLALLGAIIANLFLPLAEQLWFQVAFTVLSLVYGFTFVAPIGGADMPVVISLLNSLTGISAALAGLIYDSNIMIIGGILVGASGTILTIVMCEAMNRSLFNVVLGGFGSSSSGVAGVEGDQTVKETNATDVAIQTYYAKRVMIVPGYGLAVAQAQKVCQELDQLLTKNGVEVIYAIHPVAGRMPGHMNVLLAEADVDYSKLLALEEANDKVNETDCLLVVGANDVVNPAANDEPGSPIFGMPVVHAWEAKHVVILKRSMSSGYAGIQNPLFFKENAKMFFGDAKDSLNDVVAELKNM